jgi:hypothetical protein
VFRREDFCPDDWEDTVIDLVGVSFNRCGFMFYCLLRREDFFMFDGGEIVLVDQLIYIIGYELNDTDLADQFSSRWRELR